MDYKDNERENPQKAILQGFETVSKPAELAIHHTRTKPSTAYSKNMLEFANSLNKFAQGTLAIDRIARLEAQEKAKKLYLEQENEDKLKWADLTEKQPLLSRINPYTKQYYGDLVATQIADSNISQLAHDYSVNQLISKPINELNTLIANNKQKMSEQLNNKELSPSNQIKAIEKFETSKSAIIQDYLPKNAQYKYKETRGIFRESATQRLIDLDIDYSKNKPDENIKTLENTINTIANEAFTNGIVKEDVAEELKISNFNYIEDLIFDPLNNFNEAQYLQALKNVRIDGKTLNELSSNFISDTKQYIQHCYDLALSKEERTIKLEEDKIKNARLMGNMELYAKMSELSDPTSPESIKIMKSFVGELIKKDPYYRANLGEFYKTVSDYTGLYDNVSSYESRHLLANYFAVATTEPYKLNLSQIQKDYDTGKLKKSDYISLLGVLADTKNKKISTEAQLLTYTHAQNQREIASLEINDKLKAEMQHQENEYFITAFRNLHNPEKLNPNAYNKYDNDTRYILNIAQDKSGRYDELEKQQTKLDKINADIEASKQSPAEPKRRFLQVPWAKQYTTGKLNPNITFVNQGIFKQSPRTTTDPTIAGLGSLGKAADFKISINQTANSLYNQSVVRTSKMGHRTITDGTGKKISRMHEGEDFAPANKNSLPIIANIFGDAQVYTGFQSNGAGNYIKIIPNSHKDCSILLMHLGVVAEGLQKGKFVNVKNMAVLGIMGKTGNATGYTTHVQYEIKGRSVSEQEFRQYTKF